MLGFKFGRLERLFGLTLPAFAWILSTALANGQYTVTKLSIGGTQGRLATGAPTPRGEVAGTETTANNLSHAFYFNGSIVRDLGTFGGTRSAALAMNQAGQVVGFANTTGDTGFRAFLWTEADGMLDLGTLGGTNSQAQSINSSGQIAGYSQIAGDAAYHAFLWTRSGGMVDLGTLGGTNSFARDISDSGRIVGFSDVAVGSGTHAFTWTQNKGMVDLGTPGGSNSIASDQNAAGKIAGWG